MLQKRRGRPPKVKPNEFEIDVTSPAPQRQRGKRPDESDSTRFSIDFGECAPILRKIAKEQNTSVALLVAGMVALYLQEGT